mmetsp:Transcript_33086/g.97616  ORF Transcript_33086/g.97616 Transcript_33086/m.97616 type:complete len:230 (+) Transcript_33086:160-849(+)
MMIDSELPLSLQLFRRLLHSTAYRHGGKERRDECKVSTGYGCSLRTRDGIIVGRNVLSWVVELLKCFPSSRKKNQIENRVGYHSIVDHGPTDSETNYSSVRRYGPADSSAIHHPDWQQVKEIDHEAKISESNEQVAVVGNAGRKNSCSSDTSKDWTAERHKSLVVRIPRPLFHGYGSPQERHKHHGFERDAEAMHHQRMAALVHENQSDHSGCEWPTVEHAVCSDGHEH